MPDRVHVLERVGEAHAELYRLHARTAHHAKPVREILSFEPLHRDELWRSPCAT